MHVGTKNEGPSQKKDEGLPSWYKIMAAITTTAPTATATTTTAIKLETHAAALKSSAYARREIHAGYPITPDYRVNMGLDVVRKVSQAIGQSWSVAVSILHAVPYASGSTGKVIIERALLGGREGPQQNSDGIQEPLHR